MTIRIDVDDDGVDDVVIHIPFIIKYANCFKIISVILGVSGAIHFGPLM